MKGEVILKILEKLSNTVIGFSDLFEAMLNAGYGASLRGLDYELAKIRRGRDKKILEKQARLRYYQLIYKLKKEQLIQEQSKNNNRLFKITKKGLYKLKLLKELKAKNPFPPPSYYAEGASPSPAQLLIVVFDVPEREKNKRNWLRAVLKRLGLKMLQRSVWAGKVRLPENFINDLFKFKMIDFVEIFKVTKSGSLKQVT